jgi:hypothetical protein
MISMTSSSSPIFVVLFVIALLITIEAIFLVSVCAYLINVGSMPLFTSHIPSAVDKRKKTNDNNSTYRKGNGPLRGRRPRNLAKQIPPYKQCMQQLGELA